MMLFNPKTPRQTIKSPLTTLRVLCLHLLLARSCAGQQLIGSAQPIEATRGDDIILPCRLEPAADASGLTLEWARPDLNPRFVHLLRSGQELANKKHQSFRGRTSLFVDQLHAGNVSLKLSNVTLGDGGTYKCFLPGLDRQTSVQLVVVPQAASSPPTIMAWMDRGGGGAVLRCESGGWYPQPELLWLDAEGKLLPAGPAETARGPGDLYTVTSTVTVEKRRSNSFTCRVQQNTTHQTRDAPITVPEDLFRPPDGPIIAGLAAGLAVSLLLLLLRLLFFVWRRRADIFKSQRTRSAAPHAGGRGTRSEAKRPEDQLTGEGLELMADGEERRQEERRKEERRQEERRQEERRQEAEEEVQALKEDLESKKKEVETKDTELQRLKEELENKNKELDIRGRFPWFSMGGSQRGQKTETEALKEKLKEMEMLKKKMEAQQKESNNKIKKMEEQQQSANSQWKKTNEELKEAKSQLEITKAENSQMNEQLQREQRSREQAEEDVKQLAYQNVQWQEKLNEETSKRKEAEREVEALREELRTKGQNQDHQNHQYHQDHQNHQYHQDHQHNQNHPATAGETAETQVQTPQEDVDDNFTCAFATQCMIQDSPHEEDSSSANQSAASGPVFGIELHHKGQYIRLRNVSPQHQQLGGCMLEMQVNRKIISLTFEEPSKLKARDAVTMSGPGCRTGPLTRSLRWKDFTSFSPNDELKFTLINIHTRTRHELRSHVVYN